MKFNKLLRICLILCFTILFFQCKKSNNNYEEEQVNEVNDVEESYEAELTNHKCEDKKALSSRNLGVSDSAAPPEPPLSQS